MRGSPHGVRCSSGCSATAMASVRAAVRAAAWSPIGVLAAEAAAARDVRARVSAQAGGRG